MHLSNGNQILMLNDFLNSSSPHLHKKWLIAVSGGIDSMVLWDLVSKAKINYGIAHCNFNLRGNESLEDQNFVHNRAIDLKVPFFSQSFNTYKYAKEKKISIQEAARFLRYDWLFTIAKEHDFNIISTGHQLNDEIETIIFRIAKGTGFKGLRGIPQENGIIFRPLLFASSEQINSYALEMNIEFRNDSSNLSRKYSRNLIRLEIIPKLKNIN
ncbi:MAG: tRNA lysidine(34) synthetase TilS, partial [Bacteroidota bacterium]